MEKKPIPYGRQHITEEDLEAVKEALLSDYLTQGPRIKEFEDNFAKYIGCKYAVAVSNGTAALHLSAMALNVKPGDKVITTPLTFVASANCVRYCGGEVVFADIDPETYLLDLDSVKELLESSPKGTYAGIIPVDFAGRAVNLEEFKKVADEYDLWILEDACHAPGGCFVDANNNGVCDSYENGTCKVGNGKGLQDGSGRGQGLRNGSGRRGGGNQAIGQGRGRGGNAGQGLRNGSGRGNGGRAANFVDANNNGICDRRETTTK